jgi:tetratricopeptide (TPR) repeat protein
MIGKIPSCSRAERPVSKRLCAIVLTGLANLVFSFAVQGHGDLHEQIVAVTGSISADPENAVLFHKRGELHRAHGDYPEALRDYAQAQKLSPALHVVYLSRGRALFESGEFARALVPLNAFMSKEPNHIEARWLRGRLLAKLGNRDEAELDFKKVLNATSEPSPEQFIERAQNLEQAGRDELAKTVIIEGIQRLGPLITLELEALDLELELKEFDAALRRVNALLETAERKESFLVRKAGIYEQMGDKQRAEDFYEKALGAIAALPERQRSVKSTIHLEEQIRIRLKELGSTKQLN